MIRIRYARALAGALVLPLLVSGSVFAASSAPARAVQSGVRTAEENRILQDAGVKLNVESTVANANDFALGPARFNLELEPGEERIVEVQVTSRTQGMQNYVFETEDFAAGTDANNATTLFGAAAGPYPARTWVRSAVPTIRMTFGERAFMPVVIRVPTDAEPGDHYAALLLRRTLNPGETTNKGFDVISRVGVLFLVTVKGPVEKNASISSFKSRKKLYWFFPARLDLHIKNEGTVYASPTGSVQIKNILGLTVDELPVRDWVVLRNSSRLLSMEWHPTFALGRYTATTDLKLFDETVAPLTTSFWMIPALPVLLAIFAIFAVSFLVQFFFSRFEIKKKG